MERIKRTTKQFAIFIIIGAIATIAHYSTLIICVEWLHTSPTLGALMGFCVGGAVGYPLNKKYAFESDHAHSFAIPRFVVVIGFGFIFTGLIMHELTTKTPLHYIAAQVITTLLVLLWHFAAHKFWTFKNQSSN